MRPRSRLVELWLIAAVFAVGAFTLWSLGRVFDEPLLSFAGLMTLASTFVPMPADAYVVNAARHIDPVTIGLLGGAINAVAVLGERMFFERLVGYPIFDRLMRFIGTNRFVDVVEKQMFVGLVIAAASPLPFEVFRVMACARNYSKWRYALATFIGRGGRYYALALGSTWFESLGLVPWIVGALVFFFVVGLVQSIRRFRGAEAQVQADVEST